MVTSNRTHFRVAIIGAGFAGIGAAVRLRRQGIEDFVLLEKADEVGGTWRDNSYPGCECDVMSLLYSFSFAQNPDWSHTFSPRDELYAYLRECADRFGVRPHIRFGHELRAARWDDDHKLWRVETSQGDYTAEILVVGTGHLSTPAIPELPGMETFTGKVFHSASWDHDYDLSGKRVAVVGTGASAIQFVPKIQPALARLDLYQRTPPWVLPKGNKPVSKTQRWLRRHLPGYQSFRRAFNYYGREILAYLLCHPKAMDKTLLGMARKHIEKGIADPALRAKLTPDYVVGCKRMLMSDEYYPALAQPNVDVVTTGVRAVGPNSITSADGQEREVDAIIFGTGFRPKDRPVAHQLFGRDGRSLAETWSEGMSAYVGTTIAGFPNLFMMLGPNTTLAHSAETVMIEAQVDYLADALRTMDRHGISVVDVRQEDQDRYNERIESLLDGTVWTVGHCNSGYLDERGRNPLVWPTYVWRFRRLTKRFDIAAYRVETTADAGAPATIR